jgi:hypothetical protein
MHGVFLVCPSMKKAMVFLPMAFRIRCVRDDPFLKTTGDGLPPHHKKSEAQQETSMKIERPS